MFLNVAIVTTTAYSLSHIKGTHPARTFMGQGGASATSSEAHLLIYLHLILQLMLGHVV